MLEQPNLGGPVSSSTPHLPLLLQVSLQSALVEQHAPVTPSPFFLPQEPEIHDVGMGVDVLVGVLVDAVLVSVEEVGVTVDDILPDLVEVVLVDTVLVFVKEVEVTVVDTLPDLVEEVLVDTPVVVVEIVTVDTSLVFVETVAVAVVTTVVVVTFKGAKHKLKLQLEEKQSLLL